MALPQFLQLRSIAGLVVELMAASDYLRVVVLDNPEFFR
jgi:hypothetical protein